MGSSKQTLQRIFSCKFQDLNRYYHPWLANKQKNLGKNECFVLRFEASRTLAGYKWWYLFAHSTQLVVSISVLKEIPQLCIVSQMFLKWLLKVLLPLQQDQTLASSSQPPVRMCCIWKQITAKRKCINQKSPTDLLDERSSFTRWLLQSRALLVPLDFLHR